MSNNNYDLTVSDAVITFTTNLSPFPVTLADFAKDKVFEWVSKRNVESFIGADGAKASYITKQLSEFKVTFLSQSESAKFFNDMAILQTDKEFVIKGEFNVSYPSLNVNYTVRDVSLLTAPQIPTGTNYVNDVTFEFDGRLPSKQNGVLSVSNARDQVINLTARSGIIEKIL